METGQSLVIKQFNTKYPRINDIDKEDIGKFFISLSVKGAEQLFVKIRQEFSDDFPTLIKIRQFASSHGITPEIQMQDNGLPAQRCNKCGQIFGNKKDRIQGVIHCPRCGTMTDITLLENVSDRYITFAQDNCWKCPMFRSGEKTRGLYGPSCPEYGINKRTPQCDQCKCRECCKKFISVIPRPDQEERKEIQEKKDWRKVLLENKDTDERLKNTNYAENKVVNIRKEKEE